LRDYRSKRASQRTKNHERLAKSLLTATRRGALHGSSLARRVYALRAGNRGLTP
jgi:hypothetical protein